MSVPNNNSPLSLNSISNEPKEALMNSIKEVSVQSKSIGPVKPQILCESSTAAEGIGVKSSDNRVDEVAEAGNVQTTNISTSSAAIASASASAAVPVVHELPSGFRASAAAVGDKTVDVATKLYMDQETLRLFSSSSSSGGQKGFSIGVSDDPLVSSRDDMGLIEVDKTTEEAALTCTSIAGKNGKAFFPMKLHDIISDKANEDIIKWLPGGKAFIIVDKKRFATEVLPHHFAQSQFTSFTRKLSRWKFTRVPRGPFIGAYYNKLFLQGNRSLCWHMRCKNENIGKIRFDGNNNNSDSLQDLNTLNSMNAHAFDSSRLLLGGNPNAARGLSLQGFGFPQIPVSGHLSQQLPALAALQMNQGLNGQILALGGRIRELQNSNNAFNLFEHQQNTLLSHQVQQQARMLEARAAIGLNMNGSNGGPAPADFSKSFSFGRQSGNQQD